MLVAIAIQHDFAYGSYCVSASGSDTWPRLAHERKEHDSGFQVVGRYLGRWKSIVLSHSLTPVFDMKSTVSNALINK